MLGVVRVLLRAIRHIYRRTRHEYRIARAIVLYIRAFVLPQMPVFAASLWRNSRRRRKIVYPTAGIAGALLAIFMFTAQSTDAGQEKITRIVYKVYKPAHDVEELEVDTVSRWNNPLPDMPEPCIAMKVKRFATSYYRMFNDSNYIHWADAEKIGIEPMTDSRSHWQLRRPLVKMTSCEDFYIEPLKYSRPYLVPEGAAMLHEIGRRFRDTLRARGGGDYRIKVTSLLRTPSGVARLRRRNRNAVDSSVHQLGTTVDISYSRFIADTDSIPRSQEDLKAVLAEVLYAMRMEGKCWVKHEHNQPCFHISARPAGSPPPKEAVKP